MAAVTIVWDGATMEELLHGPTGPIGLFMFTRAEIVKQSAVIDCPKRTGKLSQSILKRPVTATDTGLSIIVGAYQPYAAPVHDGAVPHNIPNAFGWGPTFGIGGRFSGKFHPGNKGNPFLSKNLPLFFAA